MRNPSRCLITRLLFTLAYLTNLSDITLIFHDFPGQTIKFHDRLQAWKLKLLKFMTFEVFYEQ